jgi:hypothetical protein
MIIHVTFKTPDAVADAVRDCVAREVSELGLNDDEAEDITDSRSDRIEAQLKKWVRYGEYVTVAFNTETGTATVEPA